MKNLVHVTTSYDVFGPEKTTINECVALQQMGWNAAIVNLDWHPEPPFNVKAARAGVSCRSVPSVSGINAASLAALRDRFLSMGPGVIHSHGYKADVMTLIASRGLRIPIVTSIHGWTTENAKVKLYEKLQIFSWRFYDRIFCVSKSYLDVARCKGISDSKLHLLYNGIIVSGQKGGAGLRDLRSGIAPGGEVVVSIIGRLSHEKGHDSFLEIARRVLESGRKAKFVIVGEGGERPAIESLVARLGLAEHVTLLGHVDEMQSVYHATDIVAICSLREGLPNVLLESMLNGKPAVSFSVGGVPEVAAQDQGCLLVQPGDLATFTGKLCALIDSHRDREALGRLGRERVTGNFTFESRMAKIAAHYEELLDRQISAR